MASDTDTSVLTYDPSAGGTIKYFIPNKRPGDQITVVSRQAPAMVNVQEVANAESLDETLYDIDTFGSGDFE